MGAAAEGGPRQDGVPRRARRDRVDLAAGAAAEG